MIERLEWCDRGWNAVIERLKCGDRLKCCDKDCNAVIGRLQCCNRD